MRRTRENFLITEYLLFTAVTIAVFCLCVCAGSVRIPLADTFRIVKAALLGQPQESGSMVSILLTVRIPRVLCVALTGAALSLAIPSEAGK